MDFDWPKSASRLLKAQIALEGLTLAQLAVRLNGLGLSETEASLKNKLYRGTFATTFFMQCLHALGQPKIDVSSVIPGTISAGRSLDEN